MKTRENHITGLMLLGMLLLALALAGCAGGRGAIRPNNPDDVIQVVKNQLEQAGMTCEYRDNSYDEITCGASNTYKTLIRYYSQSKRLRFMSLFGLSEPCESIYPEVMAYNWGYNVAQASCQEDTIAFLSYVIVPDAGLNGTEIRDFLIWWGGAINDSLKDSGLWNNVK